MMPPCCFAADAVMPARRYIDAVAYYAMRLLSYVARYDATLPLTCRQVFSRCRYVA